jgi:hypothetical protein
MKIHPVGAKLFSADTHTHTHRHTHTHTHTHTQTHTEGWMDRQGGYVYCLLLFFHMPPPPPTIPQLQVWPFVVKRLETGDLDTFTRHRPCLEVLWRINLIKSSLVGIRHHRDSDIKPPMAEMKSVSETLAYLHHRRRLWAREDFSKAVSRLRMFEVILLLPHTPPWRGA